MFCFYIQFNDFFPSCSSEAKDDKSKTNISKHLKN